jgi:hypothetical protein
MGVELVLGLELCRKLIRLWHKWFLEMSADGMLDETRPCRAPVAGDCEIELLITATSKPAVVQRGSPCLVVN